MEPERIDIDPRSPEAAEARAEAQRLLAARLGGDAIYTTEFNSRFGGGPRALTKESVVYLLNLIDALVLIADCLAVAATLGDDDSDDDENARDVRDAIEAAKSDPQQLLAFIDLAIEKGLKRAEEEEGNPPPKES